MNPMLRTIALQALLAALLGLGGATTLRAQTPIDMRVTLASVTPFATPGGTIRIRAIFLRFSLDPMLNPLLTIELPGGVSFLSAVPSDNAPACVTPPAGGGGSILCSLTPTAFHVLIDLDVRLSPDLAPNSFVRPVARVSSDAPDPDPSNNESIAAIYLQASGASTDLGVSVAAFPDPVAPGGLFTHRIVLTNSGPDTAVSPRIQTGQPSVINPQGGIVPLLPATTTFFASGLPENWSCTVQVPPPIFPTPPFGYSCSAPTLPVGSVTLTLTGTVRSAVAGPLGVSATVSSNTPDPDPGNNQSGQINVAIGFAPALPIPASGGFGLALLLAIAAAMGAMALHTRR